jgi:Mn-dependent DtxR family transcriptional regulator
MTAPPPPPPIEEVKQKIVQQLQRVKQAASRDIAKAIKTDKHLVDKAIIELISDGRLIYVNYGGVTYVALAGQAGEEGKPASG